MEEEVRQNEKKKWEGDAAVAAPSLESGDEETRWGRVQGPREVGEGGGDKVRHGGWSYRVWLLSEGGWLLVARS